MLRSIFTLLALAVIIPAAGCDTVPAGRSFSLVLSDRDASERPVSGPALVYPTKQLVARREGVLTVQCTVQASGSTKDCLFVAGSDEPEFRQAALEYVSHNTYAPGIRKGAAAETVRRWTIFFGFAPKQPHAPARVQDPDLPPGALPPILVATGRLVYPPRMLRDGLEGAVEIECMIALDGWTRDCRVTNGVGGAPFLYAALSEAQNSRYAPPLLDGKPIESRHRWTFAFRVKPSDQPEPPLPLRTQPIDLPVSPEPIEGIVFNWRPGDATNPPKGGFVRISCLVTVKGDAKDCTVATSSGNDVGDLAVQCLVARLHFGPALRDGVPVETRGVWNVDFSTSSATING